MRRHLALTAATSVIVLLCITTAQASWVFRPSYFSHDPADGQRVAQYSPGVPPQVWVDPTYRQSAYRHNRMTLRGADGSIDRLHVVETWGEGEFIRPYGEWQFPFRAGATQFGPWGNPQGPWTSPFGSWMNPYGLGQLPYPPWGGAYPVPYSGPRGYPRGGPRPVPHGSPGGPHP